MNMLNEKVEIFSLFELTENDRKKITSQYFKAEVTVCVCEDFYALLKSDGTVMIGRNDTEKPSEKWSSILKISSGLNHIAGLRPDGTVLSFGSNTYGQCNVESWKNVKELKAGANYTIGITDDEEMLVTGILGCSDFSEESLKNQLNKMLEVYDAERETKFNEILEAHDEKIKNKFNKMLESYDIRMENKFSNAVDRSEFDELKATVLNLSGGPIVRDTTSGATGQQGIQNSVEEKNTGGSAKNRRCMSCMKEYIGNKYCPYCGFDSEMLQAAPLLPIGHKLKNGMYTVGKMLSKHSEGNKYIGYNESTNSKVLIHEFLPLAYCGRPASANEVKALSGLEKRYSSLKGAFVKYYLGLMKFPENSAMTKIHDIFAEGETSYIVEEYVDGCTFAEYIATRTSGLDWKTICKMFKPVAVMLSDLHEKGLGHYGISPEHIIVTRHGELKVIAFDTEDFRHMGGAFEPELMKGCAAFEQYDVNGKLNEATDIYGFTSTIYYALTARRLENANMRMERSNIPIPNSVFQTMPKNGVELIKGGLWVSQASRIQTFKYLLNYFF